MATIIVQPKSSATGDGDDPLELAALAAEKDQEARDCWFDDEWRTAEAAVIAETIYEGFITANLLDRMADVETVADGDRITVDEVSGLQVFYVSNGGQIDESSLTEKTWTLPQDYIAFQVVELVEKMRSGFSRRSGQIVDLAIKQMIAAVNRRLWGLYQAAIPGTGSPYYVEANGVSLPQLDAAIAEVQDEAMTDEVTILGRGVMTRQIVSELRDLNGFTPETNEEMLRRGRLGVYMGANIIQLANYKDSRKRSYIPANEMMVVTPGAAKVGFWGTMYAEEYNERGGFYWHNLGRRTIGMALRKPEYVRRIVDTSRNP